jgi:hypothetical protein
MEYSVGKFINEWRTIRIGVVLSFLTQGVVLFRDWIW